MTVARKHSLYAAEIGGTLIDGITRQQVTTGAEVRGEVTSGQLYTRHQALIGANVGATFSTRNVATLLGVCGLTGVDLSSSNLKLYAAKLADGATLTAGANHRKHTLAKGLLHLGRLACDHRGDATIDLAAIATSSDGTSDPIAVADSQSLPEGLSDGERFTLGPVTLESIAIPQLRSVELDFGVRAAAEGADSNLYNTHCSIAEIQPVLTLRGIDLEWLKATNIPLKGLDVTHTNTTVYFRKRDDGGTFVADGTAQHIKLTMAGLATIQDVFDGSGNKAAECSLVLPLKYDGTNSPVVINAASAIT